MPEIKNAPILKGRKRELSRCHPRFLSGRFRCDLNRTLVILPTNGGSPGDSYSPLGFRIAAQEGFSTLIAIRLSPTRTRLEHWAFTRFRHCLYVMYRIVGVRIPQGYSRVKDRSRMVKSSLQESARQGNNYAALPG